MGQYAQGKVLNIVIVREFGISVQALLMCCFQWFFDSMTATQFLQLYLIIML